MLPHDLPPYSTVYHYFQKWQRKGIWQQMHDQIREQLRSKLGRSEQSRVSIGDSQSVKTTEKRGWSTASMVAKRLRDVNATLSLTRKGS
jgi:putative transposase